METDFPPAPPERAPWGPGVYVGGTLLTTFALGFTEGCLEIERRPIPLRFALRFAAFNVLPSSVWSSVPARHVAAASGVPLSALIREGETCSITVGKRLVLVKSIRSLRLAVGSYGLAWSLWRCYDRNNDKLENIKYGESVVRLAPINSPLSRTSKLKHGEHIVTVPMAKENWKMQGRNKALDAVDWEKMAVEVLTEEEVERIKVIEVELSDETATHAEKLKAKATKETDSVFSVAILPMSGQPLPTSLMDTFDVCFNPLSAVLKFIASICHERGVDHVLLVGDDEHVDIGEDTDLKKSLHLSTSLLTTGLLYRHGITTSELKTQQDLVDEVVEGPTEDPDNSSAGVVFVISETFKGGYATVREMREQGVIAQQQVCFIVEESLSGQNVPGEELQAQSEVLGMTASVGIEEQSNSERQEAIGDEQETVETYFSVADVTDQTLQGIRQLVRQGKKSDAIQTAVYQAYGTQRVIVPTRVDQFSKLHI